MPRVDVAVGLGEQFESRENDDGQRERVHGIDDLNVGMKWLFLEESTYLPRQTIAPSVKFPTADDGMTWGAGRRTMT